MIELHWLIAYGSSGVIAGDSNDDNGSSSVGGGKECEERVEPVLVLLFDSYSELEIISVGVSGLSSHLTLHYLLTT